MTASVISISSDVSIESVRSSFPRVILIGSISVEIPVALEVGAAAVVSPVGVLKLDTHSSSEADPSESSPSLRSRFASRSSSPTTSTPEIPTVPILHAPSAIVVPSSEFPLAPIVAPPGIRRPRAILIRPEEDIPIGRLYRTHPSSPCRALTTRKSVRPLPSHLPNYDALRKCILKGPYTPTIVTTPAVPATDDSPAVPEQTTVKTVMNMTPKNKAHFESEKEAIYLILIGIGDEIYSTVDACQTAQEMWEAIKRIQQGESLNIQDVKTNLFWEFGQFTSYDGETIESYYTRFYKMMNEMIRNNLTVATMQLDEVSYHKLFDILKQYQKEVNELRVERMAKNANLLALVATAQTLQDPYYQSSKSHKSYAPTSKASLPTRSHATTRYKGKEIAKPITPPSESASEEDSDPEQAQRDKDMQKNLALIAKYFKKIYKPTNNNLRTSSNTRNKNVDTTPRYKNDNQTGQFGNQRAINIVGARETVGGQVVQQSGIQCFNCKEFGHYAKECRKPKWVKDSTYYKEMMLLCKQDEKGVQLQAEL
ncbi:retrovirus-related pol polyprotein from transposon TNT 1-94 [Tanacetum coccineum]